MNVNRLGWLLWGISWMGWSLLVAGCASMVAGDGSPPTRYYLLSAMTGRTVADHQPRGAVRLALEPVELPDYLSRPQIVSRQGDHRLMVAESDLWAEELAAGLARVMVENLSLLLDSDQIWHLPVKRGGRPDFRLWIRMVGFEIDALGRPWFAARWRLQGPGDQEGAVVGEMTEIRGDPVGRNDQEAQVAALSALLETFSRRVAARLTGLRLKQSASIAAPMSSFLPSLPDVAPLPRP
ncbi:MAG: membrane integrity-associated transporter subunit PqiC [Magnetococcales bacterium]|nr:membrane integrity-associated transporter subunit PqiC [Magnetococcales bacterium]